MKLNIADKVVSLCGRRGSGKSQMIKYLYNLFKNHFDTTFVISPTEYNDFYKNECGIDEKNISLVYSNDWVMALIEKMAVANKGKTKTSKDFRRVLLILDDCCSDVAFRQRSKQPGFHSIIARGRHLGIAVIIAMQHVCDLPPNARENSDYFFIGKCTSRSKKILEDNFCDGITQEEFREMMKQAGEDYKFILINNSSSSNDPDDVYAIVKSNE
jgi:energy-coupling factor transporter ATP-binding protein EcfA2